MPRTPSSSALVAPRAAGAVAGARLARLAGRVVVGRRRPPPPPPLRLRRRRRRRRVPLAASPSSSSSSASSAARRWRRLGRVVVARRRRPRRPRPRGGGHRGHGGRGGGGAGGRRRPRRRRRRRPSSASGRRRGAAPGSISCGHERGSATTAPAVPARRRRRGRGRLARPRRRLVGLGDRARAAGAPGRCTAARVRLAGAGALRPGRGRRRRRPRQRVVLDGGDDRLAGLAGSGGLRGELLLGERDAPRPAARRPSWPRACGGRPSWRAPCAAFLARRRLGVGRRPARSARRRRRLGGAAAASAVGGAAAAAAALVARRRRGALAGARRRAAGGAVVARWARRAPVLRIWSARDAAAPTRVGSYRCRPGGRRRRSLWCAPRSEAPAAACSRSASCRVAPMPGVDAVGCERVADLAGLGERPLRQPGCLGRHRRHEVGHGPESGEDVVGSDSRRHVPYDQVRVSHSPASPRARAHARRRRPARRACACPFLVSRSTGTALGGEERLDRLLRRRRAATPGSRIAQLRGLDAVRQAACPTRRLDDLLDVDADRQALVERRRSAPRSTPLGDAGSRRTPPRDATPVGAAPTQLILGCGEKPARVGHRHLRPAQRALEGAGDVAVAGEAQPAALGVAQAELLHRRRRRRAGRVVLGHASAAHVVAVVHEVVQEVAGEASRR